MNVLEVSRSSSDDEIREATAAWVEENVPRAWRDAAARGGRAEIRTVRPRKDYEAWYPTFAESGLAVATWPREYLGLDLTPAQARVAEDVLAPYNLGRLNPLGINAAAPAFFAHGTEEQRLRFLPPLVRNDEKWCQLLSEPGAGSDLASLATRAIRDGDEWVITGQKVWTTWAHFSDFAVCLTRTDPEKPKREGLTYFVVDLHAPGVDVRPLRHMGGEVDFNEVFLDEVRVPDAWRIGAEGDGWRVANSSLAGERKMVSSGGGLRLGGGSAERLLQHRTTDPVVRQRIVGAWIDEKVRTWTNARVRDMPSLGKVHQGSLNQRIQLLACDLLGPAAMAWEGDVPFEVHGMLRSRANTIEGGTTEVNKNVLGERTLGLPREPDPWADAAWEEIPRS